MLLKFGSLCNLIDGPEQITALQVKVSQRLKVITDGKLWNNLIQFLAHLTSSKWTNAIVICLLSVVVFFDMVTISILLILSVDRSPENSFRMEASNCLDKVIFVPNEVHNTLEFLL